MPLKPRLTTALAIAVACLTSPLRAEVVQTVTLTVTTYTQATNYDTGTVWNFANPIVKTYNTQAILNFLAHDKQVQGQWNSSVFPAGAKLVLTTNTFLVLDSANHLLADVSDILKLTAAAGGSEPILSGKWSETNPLSLPSSKIMELLRVNFDDTALPGETIGTFYVQGVATQTVTDTVPTALGAYTETRTFKIPGAAGTGRWSNGSPFVCSGNLKASGRQGLVPPASTSGSAP